MLDMSRNGVMKPEQVKQYLNYIAAMGLNMLMLYTEDTYELKDYPYFGYMRGRYTQKELKEIDDHADKTPCYQLSLRLCRFSFVLRRNPACRRTRFRRHGL